MEQKTKPLKWWLQLAVAVISAIIGALAESKSALMTSLIGL